MSQFKLNSVFDAFQLPQLDEDVDGFHEWAASVEFDGYTSERDGCIAIETDAVTIIAEPGDWIIKGPDGEFYACKPDAFAATYNAATQSQAAAAVVQQAINLASVRYIVIGHGETDHARAEFVQTRDELLDATLGMIYASPFDANADIREAYRLDLEDEDEWSSDGIWRTEFEIGGIVIYDLGGAQ